MFCGSDRCCRIINVLSMETVLMMCNIFINNHDQIHRICNPSGVLEKTNLDELKIYGFKFGVRKQSQQANTKGTAIFPYQKQVRNPAVWTSISAEFAEGEKNGEGRKEHKRAPLKTTMSITFGSGLWKERGFR